jgi:hypothetical protein
MHVSDEHLLREVEERFLTYKAITPLHTIIMRFGFSSIAYSPGFLNEQTAYPWVRLSPGQFGASESISRLRFCIGSWNAERTMQWQLLLVEALHQIYLLAPIEKNEENDLQILKALQTEAVAFAGYISNMYF